MAGVVTGTTPTETKSSRSAKASLAWNRRVAAHRVSSDNPRGFNRPPNCV